MRPVGLPAVALSTVGPLLSPTPHSDCPALHLSLRPSSLESNPTFPNLGFLAGAKGVSFPGFLVKDIPESSRE